MTAAFAADVLYAARLSEHRAARHHVQRYPVAVSALALGPVGGLIAGSVFGLTSFLQAIGVGGVSCIGSTLLASTRFSPFCCALSRVCWTAFCSLHLPQRQ